MTPAERDEVRRIAEASLALGGADVNECDVNALARAVLRYVPPGLCIGIDPKALPVEFKTIGIRNAAHALHAAADAAGGD